MDKRQNLGFTLVEVLVALAIVAVALGASSQVSGALIRMAERETLQWLAMLCANNALGQARLNPDFPAIGVQKISCKQAGRDFWVTLTYSTTPNPSFRRLDVQVSDAADAESSLLQMSTVMGRH